MNTEDDAKYRALEHELSQPAPDLAGWEPGEAHVPERAQPSYEDPERYLRDHQHLPTHRTEQQPQPQQQPHYTERARDATALMPDVEDDPIGHFSFVAANHGDNINYLRNA